MEGICEQHGRRGNVREGLTPDNQGDSLHYELEIDAVEWGPDSTAPHLSLANLGEEEPLALDADVPFESELTGEASQTRADAGEAFQAHAAADAGTVTINAGPFGEIPGVATD
ncbi:hypothetical protein [Nocardiopsis xinjiangensis]|uniref:hypothetical protein n=1 Tax=Nocardiopsis xinjiangensis TaxID=124285 RepID=UPI00034CF387|nr:hypothetical protein [Nocardiopsis xinjiangensis]